MQHDYLIIFDYPHAALRIIALTSQEITQYHSGRYKSFKHFLRTLESKYSFTLDDCSYILTDNIDAYIFRNGTDVQNTIIENKIFNL